MKILIIVMSLITLISCGGNPRLPKTQTKPNEKKTIPPIKKKNDQTNNSDQTNNPDQTNNSNDLTPTFENPYRDLISQKISGITLKSRDPINYNYKVLFTNPICQDYFYKLPVENRNGNVLTTKPKNVYCGRSDFETNFKRDENHPQGQSPVNKLMQLINDHNTKEIYASYLSFSSKEVTQALCDAITLRNVKVTVVLDGRTEERSISSAIVSYDKKIAKYQSKLQLLESNLLQSRTLDEAAEIHKEIEELKQNKPIRKLTKGEFIGACRPKSIFTHPNIPVYKAVPAKKGIGWSHSKLFIVNPHDPTKVTVTFSSGNMSSGVILHHENWHFVTASSESYFIKAHLCMIEAELNHTYSRKQFIGFMKTCQENIKGKDGAKLLPEDDIKVFFTPGQGEEAIGHILEGISNSSIIQLAVHRFSLKPLVHSLIESSKSKTIQMIADDDLYYVGTKRIQPTIRVPNMRSEWWKTIDIKKVAKDFTIKYLETNHNQKLLHHNKFIILKNDLKLSNEFFNKPAIFTGAGNFTNSAFMTKNSGGTNIENYYYITIPEVVSAFNKQYTHLWNNLASSEKELPKVDTPAYK